MEMETEIFGYPFKVLGITSSNRGQEPALWILVEESGQISSYDENLPIGHLVFEYHVLNGSHKGINKGLTHVHQCNTLGEAMDLIKSLKGDFVEKCSNMEDDEGRGD